MPTKNKFKDITIYEEKHYIYGRNLNGRVLFRYSKMARTIAFFRSQRMTDNEKEFCLLMFDKYNSSNDFTREELTKVLNYELDKDLCCT
jgi:hypothetical protein